MAMSKCIVVVYIIVTNRRESNGIAHSRRESPPVDEI